jgi:hypothetical protein
MIGFIVSVFPFRNRVSFKEAFEGLELGEGKLSRPVLRGPGGRKAARLLGIYGQPLRRKRNVRMSQVGPCANVYAFVGVNHSWPGWNALRFFSPLVIQS